MLHPVGRLPESTYWRRRAVLVAALVLTVLLIKNVLLSGGSSDAATTAHQRPATPLQTTAAAIRTTPMPRSTPKPTPTRKPRVATHHPAGHRPIPTCSARSLSLFVGSAADVYRVGQIADLTLTVVNMTRNSCRAEIGPRIQEALVFHGRERLWSSNDCYPGAESNVATLSPGQPQRLVIRWSGDTSKPGCAGRRIRVGAGHYTVIGQVGTVRGRGTLTYRD